jgi:histidinol-phosphate/aromatic aminotransferase/cobyric acid decarboxylase-like protein
MAARTAVAQRFGVTPERVMLGHGASDLAFSCVHTWANASCVWLAIEPAENAYLIRARRAGARITRWRSVERTGHRVDLEQVAELMRLASPNVVSLWAPGSPTGASVPFAQLCLLAEQFPQTRFLVNQSWLSLSDDHADLELMPPANVLCIRSLSAELALPGVRAGYALASERWIGELATTRPGFMASSAAQAVVQVAMQERDFTEQSRRQLRVDRERLATTLAAASLVHTPSVAPFLLVRVARAEEVTRDLLERHAVAVCDATPYGLPDHLRISSVDVPGAQRLQAALAEVLTRRGLVRGREP